MLVALPSSSISGLGGFMTAIDFLCRRLGLAALIAPVAILVGISNVGAAAAYLSSTARLPFVVGINHYLPAVFGRIHSRWKTPYVALIFYGLAGILFGVLSQAGTSVKSTYDLLVSMSLITYFIPYLFVFAAMIRLQSRPSPAGALRLPGGKRVAIPLACLGFFSTTAAIILSAFPAEDEQNPGMALFKIVAMTLVVLLAGMAVYLRGQRSISRAAALSGGDRAMNESSHDVLALYDEEAPLEYAYTIPAAWYLDERIARLERDQVFGSNWIAVGRTDQVAGSRTVFYR